MVMLETLQRYLAEGWVEAGFDTLTGSETWTYASADAPTFTFTVPGDVTGKYHPGMRVKLTQTTVKYFIITASSYSSPNTTITVYGGTDYVLANAAITNNYVSNVKAPQGFPLSPTKWTETGGSTSTQATPTSGTTYNVGGNIVLPIGVWDVTWRGMGYAYSASALYMYLRGGLNVATNSLGSNANLLSYDYRRYATTGEYAYAGAPMRAGDTLEIASKTTYYLNMECQYSGTVGNMQMFGAQIWATCAYL